MTGSAAPRIEVNGRPADVEQLRHPALVNYGHLTAMQVRDRHVRGLDRHLARLDSATRELFDQELAAGLVRDHLRHALTGSADATVRVVVFCPDPDTEVSVLVSIGVPAEMPAGPQRLRTVPYQRPVPHIKHVGSFAQAYHRRAAQRAGFDEALLVDSAGVISETAICNFGVFDGTAVVWPDAPALTGITMQLLDASLATRGMPSRRTPIRVAELPGYRAAFIANSRGVAPVGQVDDRPIPALDGAVATLQRMYDAVGWDPI